MKEDNFILHQDFNRSLTKGEFELAKEKYLKSLIDHKYSMKSADSIYDLIENVKRAQSEIGPYKNISVFESLNRIGSDLVLLSGADKLFGGFIEEIKPKSIHLKMGTTHGFDFEVNLNNGNVVYGEAFNAATSFCKEKMRQALHKLIDKNPASVGIIFINEEVKQTIENYENQKEKNSKVKIHRVYCGKVK